MRIFFSLTGTSTNRCYEIKLPLPWSVERFTQSSQTGENLPVVSTISTTPYVKENSPQKTVNASFPISNEPVREDGRHWVGTNTQTPLAANFFSLVLA
jgi:hypothetical protein